MIIRDRATEPIDICCLCGRKLPDGAVIIRKIDTNFEKGDKVVCLICLSEIAECSE